MSDTRYTPAIRDEIERRWQEHPDLVGGAAPNTPGLILAALYDKQGRPTRRGYEWVDVHLHAQEDIQILLEGLAMLEAQLAEARATQQAPRYRQKVKVQNEEGWVIFCDAWDCPDGYGGMTL